MKHFSFYTVTYEDGRVTRGCDTFDILKEEVREDLKKDQCVEISDDYEDGEIVEVCLCTSDGCNSGRGHLLKSCDILVVSISTLLLSFYM